MSRSVGCFFRFASMTFAEKLLVGALAKRKRKESREIIRSTSSVQQLDDNSTTVCGRTLGLVLDDSFDFFEDLWGKFFDHVERGEIIEDLLRLGGA